MKQVLLGSLGLVIVLALMFPFLRPVVPVSLAAHGLSTQATVTPAGPQHAGDGAPVRPQPGMFFAGPSGDGGTLPPLPTTGRVQVAIVLSDPPSATVYVVLRHLPGVSDPAAQRLAQDHAAYLDTVQQALLPQLTGAEINAIIIGRVQNTLNAIMVDVDADKISLIRQLPGVIAVRQLAVGEMNDDVFPGAPVNPPSLNQPGDATFPGQPIQPMTE